MNIRLTSSWILAIALTSAAALPASAGGVYGSVGPDGAILISDTPPPPEAPVVVQSPVERANARVDLAEHALAVARQGLSSPRDGLRLVNTRMTRGDRERVAFYKKDLQAAYRVLTDSLRERQAPIQVAAN